MSLLDTSPSIHAEPRGARAGENSAAWQQYCEEVAAVADELRVIASRAKQAAFAADLHNDPIVAIARRYGAGSMAPPSRSVRSNATMMLGCFAALEELRQRLASFANS